MINEHILRTYTQIFSPHIQGSMNDNIILMISDKREMWNNKKKLHKINVAYFCAIKKLKIVERKKSKLYQMHKKLFFS